MTIYKNLFEEYIERFSFVYGQKEREKLIDAYLLLSQIYKDFPLQGYLTLTQYTYLKKWEEGKTLSEKLKKEYPDSYFVRHGIGVFYAILGETQRAKEEFLYVLQLRPGFKFSVNGMGIVERELQNFDVAISYCLEAARLDDTFVHPWVNLGDVYVDQRKREEAIKAYQEAIKRDSNMTEALEKIKMLEEGRWS